MADDARMSFSDEDMSEVKRWGVRAIDFMTAERLEALLARLQAAEEIHEHHAGHDEDCDEMQHGDKCSCGFEAAEIKWIKSKTSGGE